AIMWCCVHNSLAFTRKLSATFPFLMNLLESGNRNLMMLQHHRRRLHMVSPKPKSIFCTKQSGVQSVALGDPGAFFIDSARKIFHLKTPTGLVSIDIDPISNGSHFWNGNLTQPTLSHAIVKGNWRGYVQDGHLVEVPL